MKKQSSALLRKSNPASKIQHNQQELTVEDLNWSFQESPSSNQFDVILQETGHQISENEVDLRKSRKSQLGKKGGKSQKTKEQLKKRMAKILCDAQNFKFQTVRDILHSSRCCNLLCKSKYKTLYQSIGNQLISQIQNGLIQSQINFKPLQPLNRKVLLRIITNCKRYMKENQCSIIINLIKKIFQLGTYTIKINQIESLHHKLRQISQVLISNKNKYKKMYHTTKRKRELSISSQDNSTSGQNKKRKRYNEHSVKAIWTKENQQLLRQSYKEHRNLEKVRTDFIVRFPLLKHLWTMTSLQQRLNHLIRQGLHLLSAYVFSKRTNNMPNLTPLDPATVHSINKSPAATDLRILIIDLLDNNHEISSMRELILKINAFCRLKEEKIENQSNESVSSLRQSDSVKSVNYAQKSDQMVMMLSEKK